MPAAIAILGTKASISFQSGFFAEILDFTGPSLSRAVIDVTHLGSTDWREKLPGSFVDGGQLSVNMAYIPDGTLPPILEDPESITITFSNNTTWVFTGFMTGFNISNPLEDRLTAAVTIEVAGKITVTPGT